MIDKNLLFAIIEGGGCMVVIRIVKIEEWLKVDENMDWLLVKYAPWVIAAGFAAVFIRFFLL